jgi:cobalt/nickel transport protein
MVSKVTKRAIILLCIVAAILIFPLAYYNGKGEAQGYFGGSDDQGPEYIETTGYHPWVQPLWEPPSSEIESLLFALQAAIGAIIIGYVLGYWKCQSNMKRRKEKGEVPQDQLKWE